MSNRYYIIAGEASGDLHGGNLMNSLYARDPEAEIRFWGGEKMLSAFKAHAHDSNVGGLVKNYREGAVMGIADVVKSAGMLLGNLAFCREDIAAFAPDCIIYIDYPGFNLRIAKWAHKHGYRNIYYIAPKVWASREGRVRKLRRYIDKMLIIFPFEIDYFKGKGLKNVEYVGNPLVDSIAAERASWDDSIPDTGVNTIALLAGSRKGEIKTMMPPLVTFARKMHTIPAYSHWQFVICGAPARSMEDYDPYLSASDREFIQVVFGKTRQVVASARAAVVNSGTASLETVLLDTPQVVGYICASWLTYIISISLLKSKYISLGNLCVDRLAFKELLHYDCNPEALVREVRSLIEDESTIAKMKADYEEIRLLLGGGGASDRAADAIIRSLK